MGYYGSVILDVAKSERKLEPVLVGKTRESSFLTLHYWLLVQSGEMDRIPKIEKAISSFS